MHLKTKVKAEAINNLSDARYFAAMGVSWLGFSLDLSKKTNLEPETIREIIQWVQGPKIVGEFGLQPESHILEMAEQLELDYIQIPEERYSSNLIGTKPTIVETVIANEDFSDNLQSSDLKAGDLALVRIAFSSWSGFSEGFKKSLKHFCLKNRTIIDLTFRPDNLESILDEMPVMGLNLRGGNESQPGINTFDDLDRIFEILNPEF